MEIKKKQTGGKALLSLKGRLDTNTSPKLEEALSEALAVASTIELDFSGLEYVSSAGLRVLLSVSKKARAEEKTFTLKNVPVDVMEVFEITGFSGILDIK